jgi:hypothetical protein
MSQQIRLHKGLRNKIEKIKDGEVIESISADADYTDYVSVSLEGCDAVIHRGMNNANETVTEGTVWVKPAESQEAVDGTEPSEPECVDDASDEPLNPESEDSLVSDED